MANSSESLESNEKLAANEIRFQLAGEFEAMILMKVSRTLNIPVDAISGERDLTDLGIGSIQMFGLLGELSDEVGIELDAESLYDYPTPSALSHHLASLRSES